MFEEMTEQQAREQILEMTRNYCEKYHNKKKPYQKGDRIPYASRVYDAEEMVNLVDSSLEFWLTAGDRKSTRLNSSHNRESRMPSSA